MSELLVLSESLGGSVLLGMAGSGAAAVGAFSCAIGSSLVRERRKALRMLFSLMEPTENASVSEARLSDDWSLWRLRALRRWR
jgi:hypothetical protein